MALSGLEGWPGAGEASPRPPSKATAAAGTRIRASALIEPSPPRRGVDIPSYLRRKESLDEPVEDVLERGAGGRRAGRGGARGRAEGAGVRHPVRPRPGDVVPGRPGLRP